MFLLPVCFEPCTNISFNRKLNDNKEMKRCYYFFYLVCAAVTTSYCQSLSSLSIKSFQKILAELKFWLSDRASLRVVFLAHGYISLAPGNRASVIVEHWINCYYYCNVFFQNELIKPLSDDRTNAVCEGKISKEECLKAVTKMKNNKSPGSDRLRRNFKGVFGRIWKWCSPKH